MHLRTPGMEFATEMVVSAARAGMRITEVPTTLKPSAVAVLWSVLAYYKPLRGVAKSAPASQFVELSADETAQLCAVFVAAAKAGEAVGYGVANLADVGTGTASWAANVFGVFAGLTADADAAVASSREASVSARLFGAKAEDVPDAELTPLGIAVKACAVAGADADVGGVVAGFDPAPGQRAVLQLALEMDGQGFLIFGAPEPEKSLLGAGEAMGAAVEKAAVALPGQVAGFVANLTADAAFALLTSTPGLVACGVVAFIAWRSIK